jgi:phosphate-selective porin OprO/OprP
MAGLGLAGSPAWATGDADDKNVTEKVLDILKDQGTIDQKRYDELMREAQEEKAAGLPAVAAKDQWEAYWKDGTRIERKDGSVKIKFGGRVQFDAAAIGAEGRVQQRFATEGTGVDFRRARLFMSGSIGEHGIFKVQYDFAGSDADFKDVYAGLTNLPVIGTIRAGHAYEPFGLDQQTSSKYITFMERNLPTLAFSRERNSGVVINNTAFDDRMTWGIGGFREVDDTGEAFSNQGDYNLALRVTGLPVWEDDGKQLVHVGYSYRHEFRGDENVRFRARPEANTAQRLVDTGNLLSDGVDAFGAELATIRGPLSLSGEWVSAFVEGGDLSPSSPAGTIARDSEFYGASVQVSYFLTGEHRVYDQKLGAFKRTAPMKPFSLSKGQWGAFEVGARYSHLNLNDNMVRGGVMSDYTIGVNWYLYRNLRVMLNGVLAHLNGVGDTYIAQSRVSLDF